MAAKNLQKRKRFRERSNGAVLSTLGKVNFEKGLSREKKFLRALRPPYRPPSWIYEVRPATRKEDTRGIDVVVLTDVGNIYIQVKSSERAKRKFLEKRRSTMIEVIVVSSSDNHYDLQWKFLRAVSEIREELLSRHRAS